MAAGSEVTPEMVGRTCPYCRFGLERGATVIACPACGAVHHGDCWAENGGCAVSLCEGGPSLRDDEQEEAPAPQPAAPPPPPPDPSTAPTQRAEAPPPPVGAPPPGGPSSVRWVPVLVVAIVLLGGATAAAIVLTKHGRHVTETVTTPSAEAEEPSEGEYSGESGYEEPGYEEAAHAYEEEPGYEEEEAAEEGGGGTEASASSAQGVQSQVEVALRAHFHRLAYGNYDAAFADLTASEQGSAGGSAAWVEGQEEDGLESFSLSVETSPLGSHAARADIVEFQTHSLATGCNEWSGYWEMSKVYGEWLIDKAKLEKEPC